MSVCLCLLHSFIVLHISHYITLPLFVSVCLSTSAYRSITFCKSLPRLSACLAACTHTSGMILARTHLCHTHTHSALAAWLLWPANAICLRVCAWGDGMIHVYVTMGMLYDMRTFAALLFFSWLQCCRMLMPNLCMAQWLGLLMQCGAFGSGMGRSV
jgi:hypothetical protein